MANIRFSYIRMLGELYEQLDLPVPQIVVTPDADNKFTRYIDLQIPPTGPVVQTVRCTSSPLPSANAAEQETAHLAMKRLREECGFQYIDMNYDDSLLYRALYDHQTTTCTVITAQYSNLSREHSYLKECYISTVAEKNDYVNERVQLRNAIAACYAIVNRLTVGLPIDGPDPAEPADHPPA